MMIFRSFLLHSLLFAFCMCSAPVCFGAEAAASIIVDFNIVDCLVNRGLFSYQGFMQIRESGDPLGLETFKLVNPSGTDTRLEIWISRMEPENDNDNPDTFNWDKFYPERMIRFIDDASEFLSEVENYGMEHLLLLGYTVEWLRDPDDKNIPIKSIAEWVEYAAAVVQSFNGIGANYRLRARFVEVWNEPNLKDFWTGSKQLYMELFNATARRIHRDYPGVLVGGPALTGIAETKPDEWLHDFLTLCGKEADFISYHTYGEPVSAIIEKIKKWAYEYRKIPGKELGRVMITESDNWIPHHSWEKIQYMFDRQLALIAIQDLLWSFHHFCVMAYRESGQYQFGMVYGDGAVIDGTFWPFWIFRNHIGEQCHVNINSAISSDVRCIASRYKTQNGEMQNIVLHNKGEAKQDMPLLVFLPDSRERILLYSKVSRDFKGVEKVEVVPEGIDKGILNISLEQGEGLALTFLVPGKPVYAENDLNYQLSPFIELTPLRQTIELGAECTLKARILNTVKEPLSGELRLLRVPEGWEITIEGNPVVEALPFGAEQICSFRVLAKTPVSGETVAPYIALVPDSKDKGDISKYPHSIPVHLTVQNPLRLQALPMPIESVPGETNSATVLITNQSSQALTGMVEAVVPEPLNLLANKGTFTIQPKSHIRFSTSFEIPSNIVPTEYTGAFIVTVLGFEYKADFTIRVNEMSLASDAKPVDISSFLNFDSVAYYNNRLDYDREKMGLFVFPADFIPSGEAIRVYGVPFNFPSVEDGEKNSILPQGQTIPIPAGMYDAIAFIGFGHDGNHPGVWTLRYGDDTEDRVASQIPEWCTPPPAGARWIMNCPYRYIDGGPAEPPCQLFYWEIPVNNQRELQSVKLPEFQHAYIYAITVLKK